MQPGDVIADRFEIVLLAGSGGMGEVYRARDRASGEAVAVKVLLEGRSSGDGRFAREAVVLAELDHPGIVRYVARGVREGGTPFLVMEWLDGEDLGARLERERLTLDETITLATRVADALAVAHAEALHATGAHEAARAAISRARARLLAITETIGSPEYKESFLESVPENARTLELAREWLGEATPSMG